MGRCGATEGALRYEGDYWTVYRDIWGMGSSHQRGIVGRV